MNWFYTVEGLSKALNLVGFLAALLTCSTVILKFRFDAVKKVVDQEKSEERTRIDLDLRNEAVDARQDAAKANQAADELRSRLAWRQLTDDQQRDIAEAMRPMMKLPKSGEPHRIAVFSTSGSFESVRLAEQIASALVSAGAEVRRDAVTYGNSLVVSGVILLISTDPHGERVALELIKVLRDAGIAADIAPVKRIATPVGEEPYNTAISVMVGDKP